MREQIQKTKKSEHLSKNNVTKMFASAGDGVKGRKQTVLKEVAGYWSPRPVTNHVKLQIVIKVMTMASLTT